MILLFVVPLLDIFFSVAQNDFKLSFLFEAQFGLLQCGRFLKLLEFFVQLLLVTLSLLFVYDYLGAQIDILHLLVRQQLGIFFFQLL